jgi:hypothetical protein
MKKLLLSLMLVAGLGYAATAQTTTTSGGVKIGVKAGVALPKISVSGEGADAINDNTKFNTSFYVGGIVDIPVSPMFSVQPGLSLIGKGSKIETSETGGGQTAVGTYKASLMYIELPVNAVVNFQTGSGKFFIGAGPYAAMGIAGKSKSEVKVNGTVDPQFSTDEDIKFGSNEDDDFKSTDFGVNFLLGYQLNSGLNLHAGYGLGLSNISPTSEGSDQKSKNRVISVGLGFTF